MNCFPCAGAVVVTDIVLDNWMAGWILCFQSRDALAFISDPEHSPINLASSRVLQPDSPLLRWPNTVLS